MHSKRGIVHPSLLKYSVTLNAALNQWRNTHSLFQQCTMKEIKAFLCGGWGLFVCFVVSLFFFICGGGWFLFVEREQWRELICVYLQSWLANEKQFSVMKAAGNWWSLCCKFLVLMHRIIFLQFTVVKGNISGVRSWGWLQFYVIFIVNPLLFK